MQQLAPDDITPGSWCTQGLNLSRPLESGSFRIKVGRDLIPDRLVTTKDFWETSGSDAGNTKSHDRDHMLPTSLHAVASRGQHSEETWPHSHYCPLTKTGNKRAGGGGWAESTAVGAGLPADRKSSRFLL